MPCYYPLRAWYGQYNASGKRGVVFKAAEAAIPGEIQLQCGQCIGCRLERSRQWAMRCLDEASLYQENCFITLTYNDANLPEGGSLVKRDFQLFMKRLRKDNADRRIRFFHCGEYGEACRVCEQPRRLCRCDVFIEGLGRPHYHACLFNFDFDDKILLKYNDRGDKLYTSEKLKVLWPKGHSMIGDVTFDSAAYVARYCLKKKTGDQEKKDLHYLKLSTGEVLPSEYTTMSRRPGIGRDWFNKFVSDIFPDDFKVVRGVKMRAPKYYGDIYSLTNPEEYASIKARRKKRAKENEVGLDRLQVMEKVKMSKIKTLKREVER